MLQSNIFVSLTNRSLCGNLLHGELPDAFQSLTQLESLYCPFSYIFFFQRQSKAKKMKTTKLVGILFLILLIFFSTILIYFLALN